MLLRFTRLRKSPAVSGLVLALGMTSATGELAAQEHCLTCFEAPMPVSPFGQQVNRFMAVQTANAAPTRFVFFPNEWYMGGCELGPMGCQHLHAVAHASHGAHYPIIVETSGDQPLDQARRAHLVAGLERFGLGDADKRVVINFPTSHVMRGEQAEYTYLSWLFSGRNDWNRGGFSGLGVPGYFGGSIPGAWGQGFWGMGIGGGIGYGGLLGMPFRN